MSIATLISRLLGSSSVPAIEHEDMQKAVESGECHIVDVREPNEFEAGHIPGSLLVPLSQFQLRISRTLRVVASCCLAGQGAGL